MCRKVSALDHCLTNVNICSVCQQSSTAYSLLVSFFTCILLTDHHEQIWAVIGETGHWVWPFSAGHEAICPQTPKQDRWAVIAYALRFKPGLNGKWIGTWIVILLNLILLKVLTTTSLSHPITHTVIQGFYLCLNALKHPYECECVWML